MPLISCKRKTSPKKRLLWGIALFTLFRLFLLIPTLTRLKLLILLYTASTLALIIMPIYIAIMLKHYWIVAQLASEQNVGWMNGWMGE